MTIEFYNEPYAHSPDIGDASNIIGVLPGVAIECFLFSLNRSHQVKQPADMLFEQDGADQKPDRLHSLTDLLS